MFRFQAARRRLISQAVVLGQIPSRLRAQHLYAGASYVAPQQQLRFTSTCSSTKKCLPLGTPANADDTVMIPIDNALATVRDYFTGTRGLLALIRGTPSSGKTTIAKRLRGSGDTSNKPFLYVSLHECRDGTLAKDGENAPVTIEVFLEQFVAEWNAVFAENITKPRRMQEVHALLGSKAAVLIVDEAQLSWGHPQLQYLYSASNCANVLFVTTNAEYVDENEGDLTTPKEMGQRWFWSPNFSEDQLSCISSQFKTENIVDISDLSEVAGVVGFQRAPLMFAINTLRDAVAARVLESLDHRSIEQFFELMAPWFWESISASRAIMPRTKFTQEAGEVLTKVLIEEHVVPTRLTNGLIYNLLIRGFLKPTTEETDTADSLMPYGRAKGSFMIGNLFLPHLFLCHFHENGASLRNHCDFELQLPLSAADLALTLVGYMQRIDLFALDQANGTRAGPTEQKWQSAFEKALARLQDRFSHQWAIALWEHTGKMDLVVVFPDRKSGVAEGLFGLALVMESNADQDRLMDHVDPKVPDKFTSYKDLNRDVCLLMCCNTPPTPQRSFLPLAPHVDVVQICRTTSEGKSISHGLWVNVRRKGGKVPTCFPTIISCDCIARSVRVDSQGRDMILRTQKLLPWNPHQHFPPWAASQFDNEVLQLIVRRAVVHLDLDQGRTVTEENLAQLMAAAAKDVAAGTANNVVRDVARNIERYPISPARKLLRLIERVEGGLNVEGEASEEEKRTRTSTWGI